MNIPEEWQNEGDLIQDDAAEVADIMALKDDDED